MLEFAAELCQIQHRAGRVFVFEHPLTATSWGQKCMQELMNVPGVLTSVMDMCCYGMTSVDEQGEGLVRKSTQILKNAPEIADALSQRCCGGHRHVALMSGRAAKAAIYPPGFCSELLKGFSIYKMRTTMRTTKGGRPLYNLEFARADLCDPAEVKTDSECGRYIDDVKGGELDPVLARVARAEELEVFKQRGVYKVVPRSSMRPGSKILGVRWVETNKGSPEKPKVRSRLVCQEFAYGKDDPTGSLFAPTPPLAATRLLLSGVASQGRRGPGEMRAMLLDFKRAFLYGDAERELFIELPDDDERKDGGNNVGLLQKAMYGTRDAPAVWQRLVQRILCGIGFRASRTAACVYYNVTTGLKVVAHVDDFLVTGPRLELEKLRKKLQEEFEVDGDIIGLGAGEVASGKFLGRQIRATREGLEWEADEKLVRTLIDEFGEKGTAGVETPGMKTEDGERSGQKMSQSEAARFRKGAAILNYFSQDRIDLSYASKEISRFMADPQVGDEACLTRAVKYVSKYPRLVIKYPWQEPVRELSVFTDSDWGGCTRTRRSTSGGWFWLVGT